MADEKKPVARRLGGLSGGPGAGRLGSLRSGDGAGPSSAAGGSGAGGAGGTRKMRFMPTNFSRPKARPESTSEGAPSTSVSVASKSESAFEDLMKAAKSDAAWQRRGGRGGGRGFGAAGANRALTTFGGGAGEGGSGGVGGRRVWGGRGSGGGGGGGGGGTKRLTKAGDKVKTEGGKVKAEDGGMDGIAEGDEEAGGGGWRNESSEESEGEPEEDPISYDQEYPVVLPHRPRDEPIRREPDDPAKVIPKDLFDLPEHYQPMLEEISFLRDIEQNDGRLMLFQLPALLPVAAQAGADGGAGTSVAASRPAHLRELPTSKIGKLLVFESGKVKMQVGDVLLDVDPGIPPRFRQDVAVINPQSKQCVMLAPIDLRMVCSPNIDTLLEPEVPLPEWPRVGAAAAAAGVGGSEGAPPARGGAGRRAVVVSSEDEEEPVAMEVDGGGRGATNGAAHQQQQQQQQQVDQRQQQQRKGPPGVAVKKEEGEEEEVVSPRRGGGAASKVKSPRGGGVRSPRGGLRSPKAQQRGGGGNG